MRTLLALVITLFLCISCEEGTFRVETPDVEDGAVIEQTVFEANAIGGISGTIAIQAAHGTCTSSVDSTKIIYTRTNFNHHGTDSCQFSTGVCENIYTIDFSGVSPALAFDAINSYCNIL